MKKYKLIMSIFFVFCLLLSGCGNTETKTIVTNENELSKGYTLYEVGDYETAKSVFQEYINSETYNESAFIGYAKCCEQMGMLDEALAAYDKVLEYSPEHSAYLYDRASVYTQMGNEEKAYQDYEQIYELDHTDQIAWNKVETYLRENGLLENLAEKYQAMEQKEDEILLEEVEVLAALGRENEIPKIIAQLKNEEFRQLCTAQLEAYQYLTAGDIEKAKEILFSYKLFTYELEIKESYLGEHNDDFQRDGIGILLTNAYYDTQAYIGEFREGKREGEGAAYNSYIDEYEDDDGQQQQYLFQSMLTGQWKDDLPNGECEYRCMESEFQSYEYQEYYRANFDNGIVNGELILKDRWRAPEEDFYDGSTTTEKLMIENGDSVAFTYNEREVYSIEYDNNGIAYYANDEYRDERKFQWDVY